MYHDVDVKINTNIRQDQTEEKMCIQFVQLKLGSVGFLGNWGNKVRTL